MSKFNYTVFYKKENYNPYKTYGQTVNRYAGSKSFETLDEAVAFAKTVKNADIRYFHNTMKKVAF